MTNGPEQCRVHRAETGVEPPFRRATIPRGCHTKKPPLRLRLRFGLGV